MERGGLSYSQRQIVILLCLLVTIIAFGAAETQQGIDPGERVTVVNEKVTSLSTCKNITWQENEPVYGTCTGSREETICLDAPLNQSCSVETIEYSYTCEQGSRVVEHSREECDPTGFLVNNNVRLRTSEYRCSVVDDGKIYVLCDSIYDGNGDGICTSGESCMRFGIVGSNVVKEERNSGDEWTSDDGTFFLPEATAEVLE